MPQQPKVVKIFAYLGRAAALFIIVYVASQNLVLGRILEYQADWSRSVSPDFIGWYPAVRISYQEAENRARILSEPLYLQVYEPVDFASLQLSGSLGSNGPAVSLGLRQQDGTWQWQNLLAENFSLNFDLRQAARRRNRLEFILSVPGLQASSTAWLANDWRFVFSR